jgi:hypothetical protein
VPSRRSFDLKRGCRFGKTVASKMNGTIRGFASPGTRSSRSTSLFFHSSDFVDSTFRRLHPPKCPRRPGGTLRESACWPRPPSARSLVPENSRLQIGLGRSPQGRDRSGGMNLRESMTVGHRMIERLSRGRGSPSRMADVWPGCAPASAQS